MKKIFYISIFSTFLFLLLGCKNQNVVIIDEQKDPETVEISFNLNGGKYSLDEKLSYKLPKGKTLRDVEMPDPQKEGYIFQNWQSNNTIYNLDTPITSNTIFIANYKKIIVIEKPIQKEVDKNIYKMYISSYTKDVMGGLTGGQLIVLYKDKTAKIYISVSSPMGQKQDIYNGRYKIENNKLMLDYNFHFTTDNSDYKIGEIDQNGQLKIKIFLGATYPNDERDGREGLLFYEISPISLQNLKHLYIASRKGLVNLTQTLIALYEDNSFNMSYNFYNKKRDVIVGKYEIKKTSLDKENKLNLLFENNKLEINFNNTRSFDIKSNIFSNTNQILHSIDLLK